MSERGQGLAKTLAVQVVDHLLFEDLLALHDALHKAISTDSEIRYFCVEDNQGFPVAHTFEEGYPPALAELWKNNQGPVIRFRSENEPLLDISIPILEGQLGTLHVGMSRSQAIKATDQLLWIIGIALAGGLFVILVGSRLIAAQVSRPLRQLEAEVLRFSEQPHSSIGTHASGIRELDSLSKCFSEMVRHLQSLERERAATQQRMIHAEKLATLGELAAGLAHEVHNPLDGMLECLRYLDDDPQKGKRAEKYYPMLKEGLERIAKVMRQMLSFTRSGQNVFLEACQITDMVEVFGTLVQSHMSGRKVRLTWEKAGGCVGLCDKQGLAQVGLNLILNAAEAAEESADPEVRIEASCDAKWVYLSVEDSGPGIPEELRERIFEPFFTTKPVGKGTGLGLSVSRQLIRAAGGEVELDSQGRSLPGARFVIRLPKVLSSEEQYHGKTSENFNY